MVSKSLRWVPAVALVLVPILVAAPALAGPTVVPTFEGQIGETPGPDDKVEGVRFESIRGQAGELVFGGIFVFGGAMPPPPEMTFLTDWLHTTPDPVEVDATPSPFANVLKLQPASARSRNAADDGDFVAFSFAIDGAMPETMTVRLATFDETGSSLVSIPIVTDIGTTPFPDPSFSKIGVAVDDQGRVTVAYTELTDAGPSRILAQRIDAVTGAVIDPEFTVNDDGNHGGADVALLDPAGDRLVVASVELSGSVPVKANIIDFSGGAPVVLPEFPISTTVPDFANFNPAVAADPSTGAFVVAWEHITAVAGNPVDIRARRFDAEGNPVGDDFVVNATTADAQGQPGLAYGLGGESVIVWAGDAGVAGDELDVFAQAYDAAGNPIGGEVRVNTETEAVQDRPAVRFLPENDALGQSQFAVAWRDVEVPDGGMPRGTGTSYKCFSIGEDPTEIFSDGFESGDTASWSSSQP